MYLQYSVHCIIIIIIIINNTIQYNKIQYNTMRCDAMRCNAMHFSTMYERGYFRICYNVDNEDMHGLPTLSTSFQWC